MASYEELWHLVEQCIYGRRLCVRTQTKKTQSHSRRCPDGRRNQFRRQGGVVSSEGKVTPRGEKTGGVVSSGGKVTPRGEKTGGVVSSEGKVTPRGEKTGGVVSSASEGKVTQGGEKTGGEVSSGDAKTP